MVTASLRAQMSFTERGDHFVIDLPGARAAFTTRRGGVSQGPYASLNLGLATDDAPGAAQDNRAALPGLTGGPPRSAWLYQVHSADVGVLEDGDDLDERPRCDGRATRRRDVALGALGADCLTVAIAGGGAVAMVHAGWRGLAAGVLENGVAQVRSLAPTGRGNDADAPLHAAIGPGAGPCCYEVGPEVHAAFSDVPAARRGDHLDLVAVARHRLAAAGVDHVEALGLCTICRDDLFFSHRRDHGVTGRQGGLVWLTS